jgi:hypothetical protein
MTAQNAATLQAGGLDVGRTSLVAGLPLPAWGQHRYPPKTTSWLSDESYWLAGNILSYVRRGKLDGPTQTAMAVAGALLS